MRPGVPTLADATDPLNKLQRGLGAGCLWALDADRTVAHALLMHCVFDDPRWDRQLDDRDDYHATLALDVQPHTGALELWLRDRDEDTPDTTYDVLGMLGRMAVRGHADARRVLREYVAYGHYWQRALDQLIGDDDAPRSAMPWPEAAGGLDAVLVERSGDDDARAEALAGLDPRERPWTMVGREPAHHRRAAHEGRAQQAAGRDRARARGDAARPDARARARLAAVRAAGAARLRS